MLSCLNQEQHHWCGEIIKTVNYVLNKISKSNGKTSPYKVLKNKALNLSYLRTWGFLTYVKIPDTKRRKLTSRAYECIFIEYTKNSKARFYDLENKVIMESNDIDFLDDRFPFKSRNSGAQIVKVVEVQVQVVYLQLDPNPR